VAGLAYVAFGMHDGARPAASPAVRPQTFAHIFLIVEENKSSSEIVDNQAAPYINSLIRRYPWRPTTSRSFIPACRTTSRSPAGRTTASPTIAALRAPATRFGDEHRRPHRSERTDVEGVRREHAGPGWAFDAGQYVTKHDPFVYYKDIVGNAQRCRAHVVPLTRLAKDWRRRRPRRTTPFITLTCATTCTTAR